MGVYIISGAMFIFGAFMVLEGMSEGIDTETVFQQIFARQITMTGIVVASIALLIAAVGELIDAVKSRKATNLYDVEKKLDEVNDNLMMLKSHNASPQTQKRAG